MWRASQMKNIWWKTLISLFTWITRGKNHNRPVNRRATIFTRNSFYKCKAIIICCLFELVLNRYWKILHKKVYYFKVYSRSVLVIDTTFNICQHYVTEMTYQDLRNGTLISPWFPGPVLLHRHQEKSDFSNC